MTNFWNVKDKKREFLSHTQNNIKLFSNTHCTLPSHQPSYLTQSIKETKLVLDTQSRTYQHILKKEVFIFGMELVLEPFLVCVTLDNFIDTSSLCHTHTLVAYSYYRLKLCPCTKKSTQNMYQKYCFTWVVQQLINLVFAFRFYLLKYLAPDSEM